jgi:glutathione S-transferase
MFPVGTVIFINRVLLPKVRKVPGDNAKADESAAQLPPIFAYLESVLPANGFLVGKDLSIADIGVTCQLINLEHCGIKVDAGKYPKLAAYYTRIASRPSVSGIVEGERKFLGA